MAGQHLAGRGWGLLGLLLTLLFSLLLGLFGRQCRSSVLLGGSAVVFGGLASGRISLLLRLVCSLGRIRLLTLLTLWFSLL